MSKRKTTYSSKSGDLRFPDPQWMTLSEVSAEVQVGYPRVLGWVQSGRLKASDVSDPSSSLPRYRIHRDDLRKFISETLSYVGDKH